MFEHILFVINRQWIFYDFFFFYGEAILDQANLSTKSLLVQDRLPCNDKGKYGVPYAATNCSKILKRKFSYTKSLFHIQHSSSRIFTKKREKTSLKEMTMNIFLLSFFFSFFSLFGYIRYIFFLPGKDYVTSIKGIAEHKRHREASPFVFHDSIFTVCYNEFSGYI